MVINPEIKRTDNPSEGSYRDGTEDRIAHLFVAFALFQLLRQFADKLAAEIVYILPIVE